MIPRSSFQSLLCWDLGIFKSTRSKNGGKKSPFLHWSVWSLCFPLRVLEIICVLPFLWLLCLSKLTSGQTEKQKKHWDLPEDHPPDVLSHWEKPLWLRVLKKNVEPGESEHMQGGEGLEVMGSICERKEIFWEGGGVWRENQVIF